MLGGQGGALEVRLNSGGGGGGSCLTVSGA